MELKTRDLSLENKPTKSAEIKKPVHFSLDKEKSFSDKEGEKKEKEEKKTKAPHPICTHIYEKNLISFAQNVSDGSTQNLSSLHKLEQLTSILVDKLSYQVEKGISKTSIFLAGTESLPELAGSEIQITCYDTDPHRFHIDFLTSPSGALFLSKHLSCLQSELISKFPDHFFSVAKPMLNTYSAKEKKHEGKKIQSAMKKNSHLF